MDIYDAMELPDVELIAPERGTLDVNGEGTHEEDARKHDEDEDQEDACGFPDDRESACS